MVRGSRVLAGGLIAFVAFFAVVFAGSLVYDHSRRDVIAKGIRIAGVDVGGLKPAGAHERLRSALVAPLERPVVISSASNTFRIDARQAHVAVDIDALVNQALRRSREGWFLGRTLRSITGGGVHADIPLKIHYSRRSVHNLMSQVRAATDRPARDATVMPSTGALTRVPSRDGVALNATLLAAQVELALTSASAPHALSVPTRTIKPKVTTDQLASRFPTYILIDRSGFTLRFYRHLQLSRSYPIAVGMQGLETPAGLYDVQWKQTNPPWYVPNSSWAGSLAGKTIPPGPQDPLKARFMSFNGGAGIHGIDPSEYGTIGHAASHGCVRMRIPDVIELYSKTPVGTPVYIA